MKGSLRRQRSEAPEHGFIAARKLLRRRKARRGTANARAYLDRISELAGAPVDMVSVGPKRDQTIRVGLGDPVVA